MSLKTWVKALAACVLVGLAIPSGPVAAQCGRDPLYPCGVIPWPLPNAKALNSPTPYQLQPTPTYIDVTNTPSPTPTATATPPFVTTPTIVYHDDLYTDAGQLVYDADDVLGEINLDQTVGIDGEPAPVATVAASLAAYSTRFFSYVKGLTLFNFNGTGGVLTWVILALGFVLVVVVTINLIPIMAGIWRLVLRLLELIAEFIPF